jgi:hypothetical protein
MGHIISDKHPRMAPDMRTAGVSGLQSWAYTLPTSPHPYYSPMTDVSMPSMSVSSILLMSSSSRSCLLLLSVLFAILAPLLLQSCGGDAWGWGWGGGSKSR